MPASQNYLCIPFWGTCHYGICFFFLKALSLSWTQNRQWLICFISDDLIIKAKVAWLACSKTCLPGYANLTLTIPVGEQTTLDDRWKKAFDDFHKKLPIAPPPEWEVKAYRKGEKFQLVLPDLGPSFPGLYFFGEGQIVRSNAMQPVRFKNGKWELEMTRSSWSPDRITRLRGLLYRKSGWGLDPNCKFYKLDVPLQEI